MKRIVILILLSIMPIFILVCTKDKPPQPGTPENPRYYYPLQKDYSWRYIQLIKPGCTEIKDSFDLTILGANSRHSDVGYDRLWKGSDDTIFIYEKKDTLFEENVEHGVPIFKILVGPVRAGTFWKDAYYDYLIQGIEDVTLTINGETYKRCAKVVKTPRDPTPSKPDKIYEWWAPEKGEVKEVELDTLGICQRSIELRYFSPSGVFP